jgi:hypothetical protein
MTMSMSAATMATYSEVEERRQSSSMTEELPSVPGGAGGDLIVTCAQRELIPVSRASLPNGEEMQRNWEGTQFRAPRAPQLQQVVARAAAKQLSRVTHPDKCNHPQATEAQKLLSVALSAFKDDPSLREHERAREESRKSDAQAAE